MQEDLKKVFEQYPILNRINEKEHGVLERYGLIKKMEADSYMTSATGACKGVMFVIKGELKISRMTECGEETNLYNLHPGDFCHEAFSCLLHYRSLNIVGRALQDSVVVIFPTDVVKKYLLTNLEFLTDMYEDLHDKFDKVIGSKEEKVHESLDNRLFKFLSSRESKTVYMTHKDLAFEIDASREAVSRKLKEFEKKGLVRLERGRIVVLKDLTSYIKSECDTK